MRIISQNGKVDFPYEQIVISIDCNDTIMIIACAVNTDESIVFNLAEYSTKEKAEKAMAMLRMEYGNFHETRSGNGKYFDFNYPKLFRFPKDSEV